MSYALCLKCNHIMDQRHKVGEVCPIRGCWGETILVDENMIPIVAALNNKGYRTSHCCSGHIWEGSVTYIQFEDRLVGVEPPEGFIMDHLHDITDGNNKTRIDNGEDPLYDSKVYSMTYTDKLYDKQKKIYDNLSTLLKWAEGLPENPNRESDEDRKMRKLKKELEKARIS